MMDQKLLRWEMGKRGISGKHLAESIGMHPNTWYVKFHAGNFGLDDIDKICEVLNAAEPMTYETKVAIFVPRD